DVLLLTQQTITQIGADNVVSAIGDPMPGSDPVTDLGSEWISRIADSVRTASQAGPPARPIVVLERLAALFPVAGPRDVMQSLWDKPNSVDSPIVILIPGYLRSSRVY